MGRDNIDQHAVPQWYLRRFYSPHGMVEVYDCKACKFFRSKSEEIAADDECYSILDKGRRDTSVDDMNKRFKDFCAPIIESIVPNEPTTKVQRTAIAGLTANQLARTRKTRDYFQRGHAKLKWFMRDAEDIFRTPIEGPFGKLFGLSEGLDANESIAAIEGIEPLRFALSVSIGTEWYINELSTKRLRLLIAADDTQFLTSDDPTVVTESGVLKQITGSKGALLDSDVHVFLPLGPRMAAYWSSTGDHSWEKLKAEEVDSLNKLTILNVYRQVYGADEHFLKSRIAVIEQSSQSHQGSHHPSSGHRAS